MIKRIAIAVGIVAAGLGYLAWLGLHDESVEFLRPSLRGQWMVPGYTLIKFKDKATANDGLYDCSFVLGDVPPTLPVSVFSCRGFKMDVNGNSAVARQEQEKWKQRVTVDLAPYLHKGTNTLSVLVYGTNSPPALLVEGPPEVRSGTNWFVRQIGRNGRFPVALALKGEWFMQENRAPQNRNILLRHTWSRLFMGLCGAYALFVVCALIPWQRIFRRRGALAASKRESVLEKERGGVPVGRVSDPSHKEDPSHAEGQAGRATGPSHLHTAWIRSCVSFLRRHGLCLAIFLIVAGIQFRNTARFPANGGYDAPGHLEYVHIMAAEHHVPLPSRGWQTYQPPAYYAAASVVYRVFGGKKIDGMKAVQYFTTACGLMTLVFGWLLLRLLFPDRPRVQNLGFAVTAFLPVHFVTNPMVTNEVFTAMSVSAALFAAVWMAHVFRRTGRLNLALALATGLLCGLALLSKYTGLMVFAAAALWLGLVVCFRNMRNPRFWLTLVIVVGSAVAVCGWFYYRNIQLYGNPFVGNWDKVTTFGYEQPPGYRTLGYYLKFGDGLTVDSGRCYWLNFWDAMYLSLWSGPGDPKAGGLEIAFQGMLPWIGLLPVAACLLGAWTVLRKLFREQWDDPLMIILLLVFFSLVAQIAYSMKVPFYTTVHARFLLSLIAPMAVFAGIGADEMCRRLGWASKAVYLFMACLAVMVVYLFS